MSYSNTYINVNVSCTAVYKKKKWFNIEHFKVGPSVAEK